MKQKKNQTFWEKLDEKALRFFFLRLTKFVYS